MTNHRRSFLILFLLGSIHLFYHEALAQKQDALDVAARVEEVHLEQFFKGMEATFVLLDIQNGAARVYNPARAEKRFIPASTYKIANSIIAMETGIVNGPGFTLPLDTAIVTPADWWPESWRKDQTMKSAFQNSVYWFYQEIARRIGPDQMDMHLQKLNYGNQNMGGGLDTFWLHGELRISPYEQSDFLYRLYVGELGISERSSKIVKEMMVLEEHPTFRLSGKTGTAEITSTKELGWLVGFLECGEDVYVFVLNMEGERVWEDWPPHKRTELVRDILYELQVINF